MSPGALSHSSRTMEQYTLPNLIFIRPDQAIANHSKQLYNDPPSRTIHKIDRMTYGFKT